MIVNSKSARHLSQICLAAFLFIAPGCSEGSGGKAFRSESTNSLVKASETSKAEIKSAIFDQYLLGQKLQSAETIQKAFNPDSVMLYSYKDKSENYRLERSLDMHATAKEWAEQSSPDLDLSKFEILSLDIVDDRIAVATLKVEERVFDALTLVKEGDEWKIASKVYILQ
jgi:dsDNA-binding SOS-regulon protein